MSWADHYRDDRARLVAAGAYDPASERDACGVGLICALDGRPRRAVVTLALDALAGVAHRGAVAADGRSGDGAGLLTDVPQAFFHAQVQAMGRTPRAGPIAVGQIFLPRLDLAAQDRARAIVERVAIEAGFHVYGWRQAPLDLAVVGDRAAETRPEIEQVMLAAPDGLDDEAVDRALFLVRRRIEAQGAGLSGFYVCSLSARSLVHKGMVRGQDLAALYTDLRDPAFEAAVAVFHQRYSTNTFPEWRLAQPFRMLAHNGEINTLKGNLNWMRSHEIRMTASAFGEDDAVVKPVVQADGSDSSALDNVFELLVRAGRNAPMAKALLIPEAWSSARPDMPDSHRALYAYCNAVMEPWDGPAAICATDGRWVVAGKDRNGLRPLRALETVDGLLAVGSEAGLNAFREDRVKRRLSIGPGRMIAADLKTGLLLDEIETADLLAEAHPYTAWLGNMVDLEPLIGPGPEPRLATGDALIRWQVAAGHSLEDLDLILDPMVREGKEAVGSMGDDTPPALLSHEARPLAHYFRQTFSQVTNPPIDPLREAGSMSLKTRFKNLGNILAEDEAQTEVHVLDSPVLTTGMYDRMLKVVAGDAVAVVDCAFDRPLNGEAPGQGLRRAIDRIRDEAEAAARGGAGLIVLTDEHAGPARPAAPMMLAVSGVNARLTEKGLRPLVSLVVRTAEALDPHGFAVLVGAGATVVNAWLAQGLFQDRLDKGLYPGLTLREACLNYKAAVEVGLMKVLARKGVSVISSYRGGMEFDVLGLSRALTAEMFPGAVSRISGVGLAGLERALMRRHVQAWDEPRPRPSVGGLYRIRTGGERHAHDTRSIHLLQAAVTENDPTRWRAYREIVRDQGEMTLRSLLDWTPAAEPLPLEQIEPAAAVTRRMVTPGMSLGALSPEAHGALNIAMNRIGGRSVSGEGGEDPVRYQPRADGDDANSAVKQIASGRFGVTAEYLNRCREIEIKVAQGAKPGEGGQLPGFKVTEFIARMRHATTGATLISPPPHHDIYSIEDLAQLIHDLKQVNPDARVTVKLVSAVGIGAIATGVVKAKADAILIAGHSGGTGASPQSSIKHAGLPWEIGLAEAHQMLRLNGLRDQVVLRVDGGLRTGRDIVLAAMLGAEEFGIGTASLIAMGCLMVRQCHSNTCPVGVCTQDERLRERFTGTPEKVINLFNFIAEDVREHLAALGVHRLDDLVGRTDLLRQTSRGAEHLDDLDLNPLLVRVGQEPGLPYAAKTRRHEPPPSLDEAILSEIEPMLAAGVRIERSYPVRNTHRSVGARLSSALVRRWGPKGPGEGKIVIRLDGAAGQSLGAFGMRGLTLDLTGEANDYVGKGLSGADIVVRPWTWREVQLLVGNTVLYGATSGRLFVAGSAGERFAVRNSGAVAVVEGAGVHACEYMTGGTVVILGSVGWNLAAGLSGGEVFVLDETGRAAAMLNGDLAALTPIDAAAETRLKDLVTEHGLRTGSPLAAQLLDRWPRARAQFLRIAPRSAPIYRPTAAEPQPAATS